MLKYAVCLGDVHWSFLRFLFPKCVYGSSGDVVFYPEKYQYPYNAGRVQVLLEESVSGYPVFKKEGILALCRDARVLSVGKLDRITGKEYLDGVDSVFRDVAFLRVSNKSIKSSEDEFDSLLAFYALPLSDRIRLCMEEGSDYWLVSHLRFIHRLVDSAGWTQYKSVYVGKLRDMSMQFRKQEFFNSFELSGNWSEDLLGLQFYFVG